MLKAGALYYAILVSFLVALLSGFLMVNVWYHHYHTLILLQNQRLERNVNSALVLAIEKPDLLSTDQSQTIDLFNEGDDEVKLAKKQWGGFILLKSEAFWRTISFSKIELCGSDIFTDEPIALYLADKERYLSVSGNTLLKGNCYLPKLGIRRAYIEGMSFTGDELVHGKMEIAKSDLPGTDPSLTSQNLEYFGNGNFPSDSMVSMAQLMKTDSLFNSFFNKTVVFYTDQWLTLSNKNITGNIRIVSSKGITLGSRTRLQDMMVYAPKIEVSSDFTGSAQLFAIDSIIIREGAHFLYPSLITLLNANIKVPLIEIEKGCRISGDIVLLASKNSNDIQPECRLNENCVINGRVYCEGKLQMKGTVNGSVYCNGFILRTPSSLYENHLLNAIIDFPALSTYDAGALFFKVSDRYKAIKWLQ
jgi:cytoskeletal protein CcmA (bactofilin family)